MTTTHTDDLRQILAVHRGWNEANIGLHADAMLPYFPPGDAYHQFNLNGHTYHGVMDKHRLWVNLKKMGVNITSLTETVEPVVRVHGDVALLTSEAIATLVMPTPDGGLSDPVPTPYRNTEFYRRVDGEWRIWHMHCSVADPTMPKYGSQ
jgi:ketosteroid isomerase-like protein